MSMDGSPNDPGFRVTLRDVWEKLDKIEGAIDDRLRKVEIQVGAQWVVVGIVVVALGAMFARVLTTTS
jgi:hypothetical protein